MKYVLVIDVPEPMESKDVKIDYLCYYHCGDVIENKTDVWLKPLPDRAEVDEDSYGIVRLTEESFAYGWNACIDEIMGETE